MSLLTCTNAKEACLISFKGGFMCFKKAIYALRQDLIYFKEGFHFISFQKEFRFLSGRISCLFRMDLRSFKERVLFLLKKDFSGYFSRTWFRRSHIVVKILLYCTRKCGCEGEVMSASCHLQPSCNGSNGQVPALEHETFSTTVLGTPGACTRCS